MTPTLPHTKQEGGSGTLAYLVYTWHDPNKGHLLLAYRGRRTKPDAYYLYHGAEARDQRAAAYVEAAEERLRKAATEKAQPNPLNVGDLLRSSWGYEQTNVDYYQVTATTKRGVTIRPIAAKQVETTGWASDRCAPDKDNFVGEPMKKRVRLYTVGDEVRCSVKVRSFAYAYPCNENETTHRSWYH